MGSLYTTILVPPQNQFGYPNNNYVYTVEAYSNPNNATGNNDITAYFYISADQVVPRNGVAGFNGFYAAKSFLYYWDGSKWVSFANSGGPFTVLRPSGNVLAVKGKVSVPYNEDGLRLAVSFHASVDYFYFLPRGSCPTSGTDATDDWKYSNEIREVDARLPLVQTDTSKPNIDFTLSDKMPNRLYNKLSFKVFEKNKERIKDWRIKVVDSEGKQYLDYIKDSVNQYSAYIYCDNLKSNTKYMVTIAGIKYSNNMTSEVTKEFTTPGAVHINKSDKATAFVYSNERWNPVTPHIYNNEKWKAAHE